jgi:hypothetical protein
MKDFLKTLFRAFGYELLPAYSEGVTVRQLRHFRLYGRLFDRIATLPGAIVECGVGRGRSLLYFSYLAQQEGSHRLLWGFDSFEGFPEPSREDASARSPKKGEWSGITPSFIEKKLDSAGIRPQWMQEHVRLVKGFFESTLQQYDKQPIALLHIDADLYDSYVVSLNMLYPYVVKNGIILLDEYGEERWPGAKKAVDEFLHAHPHTLEYDAEAKKYYFVKS